MPLLVYNASFTVGGVAYGFDVRTHGYSSSVEANRTIREVPWSANYLVVVQRGGIKALPRRYHALVYTEQDFINLALQVNKPGLLVTPRESTPTLANLDMVARGDDQDSLSPTGQTAVELTFTMLQ